MLCAGAFLACAVMCGRAIEAICTEHKTKSPTLAEGLRELKDRQIIDQRLFDWAETLRHQRNIGAHATAESITPQDARDVLDFAIAICEYVVVLSDKYETFRNRQKRKAAAQTPPPATDVPPPAGA